MITVQVVRTGNQADRIHEFSPETHGDQYHVTAKGFAFHQAERETVTLVRFVDNTGVFTISHKAA